MSKEVKQSRYTEVAINAKYGGFGLSKLAHYYMCYLALKDGMDVEYVIDQLAVHSSDMDRDNKYLIQTVKDLGEKANSSCAYIIIERVRSDCEYFVRDCDDGIEEIEECEDEESNQNVNSIIADKLKRMSNPGNMTPEECQKILLELYMLKKDDDDRLEAEAEEEEKAEAEAKAEEEAGKDENGEYKKTPGFNPDLERKDYMTLIRELCPDEESYSSLMEEIKNYGYY